jgi:hypothetical protein
VREHLALDPSGTSAEQDPDLAVYFNRPFLLPHLTSVWESFWRLSRRRPVGLGNGAIPLTEFEAHCRLSGLVDPEQREWLFVRLEALDIAYIDYHRSKEHEKKAPIPSEKDRQWRQ